MEVLYGFSFGVEGQYVIVEQNRIHDGVVETSQIDIHLLELGTLLRALQLVFDDPDKYDIHFGENGDCVDG